MRRFLVLLAVLLLVPLAYWFAMNPEDATLDASVRADLGDAS